jgi:hypothetical protein
VAASVAVFLAYLSPYLRYEGNGRTVAYNDRPAIHDAIRPAIFSNNFSIPGLAFSATVRIVHQFLALMWPACVCVPITYLA